jgi:hypothetical protein
MKRPPWRQLGEAWPTMSESAQAETIRQPIPDVPFTNQSHIYFAWTGGELS